MPRIQQNSHRASRALVSCLPLMVATSAIAQGVNSPPIATTAGMSIPVTNCSNGGPGSLRQAVYQAVSGDTIDLRGLGCSQITLTTGAIEVPQDNLTLLGPGRSLTISGDNARSVIRHSGAGTLRIEQLSMAYGFRRGPVDGTTRGGCIYTAGNLTLVHASVHHCILTNSGGGSSRGGGIFANGNVTLLHSFIFGNTVEQEFPYSTSYGGGLYVVGDLSIIRSNVRHNSSRGTCGGACVSGSLTARYANISDNAAAVVSAIASGSVEMANSTIARNYARQVFTTSFGGDTRIVNSTISSNSADLGPGINMGDILDLAITNSTIAFNEERLLNNSTCAGMVVWYGPFNLDSTIIANNTCDGLPRDIRVELGTDPPPTVSPIDGGNNLIESSNVTLPPGTLRVDPRLAPLANNGGPTLTHALMADSPAIDMGSNSGGLSYDQRGPGFPRVKGPRADIGAFEH